MLQQNKEPLVEVCQILAEQEHLKVTVQSAAKGALITAAGAFAGALLAGPVGLAIGGTLASVTTAISTKGTYRSVSDIIKNDLTTAQKSRLMTSVRKIVGNVRTDDVMMLVSLILTQSSLKEAVIKEIGAFLLKEMNMKMVGQ